MKELIKKIKQFDEKSGLKLYQEIMDELFKVQNRLMEARTSRDLWKKKYMKLKVISDKTGSAKEESK